MPAVPGLIESMLLPIRTVGLHRSGVSLRTKRRKRLTTFRDEEMGCPVGARCTRPRAAESRPYKNHNRISFPIICVSLRSFIVGALHLSARLCVTESRPNGDGHLRPKGPEMQRQCEVPGEAPEGHANIVGYPPNNSKETRQ
jgi:hypothetical protein